VRKIGLNVAHLVEDGSTIECGIGNVSQAVAEFLRGKKDLGIHTELLSDWIIDLVESGVVTCHKKTINRGKIVASFAAGSRRLYDYINNNPMFEMHPTEYVNDPFVIAQHDKMIAINVGLEIDLTGQVAADTLGGQFYSGVGGQVDFVRGAARSRGGKAIIAMPSTARDDAISRIVPQLTDGAGVVTSRADLHYVVTEFGIAYLHGKSIRERALALINIAHPKFRRELIQAAKQMKFVYEDQIELAWESVRYPDELERSQTLRDGTQILLRPVRPTDEPRLSDMLYSLSSDSVHKRFFTFTMAFPHKNVQQLTNIDYQQNLAIVGVVPGPSEEEIVAIGQYFLDPRTQAAEIAFIVQDDWQAKGMGTLLMKYISDIAIGRGVKRFDAKVIPSNKAMLSVFQNSGLPYRSEFDGEAYSITFDLEKARDERTRVQV
jgi:acyl CoA:acetate/3-ketoacid CoA transferase beta subunit/GNAT superfamily N-acetyltransferase